MATHPNGVWIWRLSRVGGDYLDRLVECRVRRVYLKVFDGKSSKMFWHSQCSEEIVGQFKSHGIEVYGWGYHYGTSNVHEQVLEVKKALECGLDGYVVDLEAEVENASTHQDVESLLNGIRPLLEEGTFGYTSFGHPRFHPNVPWRILDEHCDIALPQIYFEKFRFKQNNEDEVQDCLKAHKDLSLTKPILPIWGSEADAPFPAPARELQSYLNRFPGSSIWRLPHIGEPGEAWNLTYDGGQWVSVGDAKFPRLPLLTRILVRGSEGEEVKALQRTLNALGLNAGEVNGVFGSSTEAAVRAFQRQAGITVDGEVDPETWGELNGKFEIDQPEQGKLTKLADLAQREGAKELRWTGARSEAEKYLKPLREPMQKMGQIGKEPVFYNWCGAFVTWCCREVGIEIPDVPEGFWATMALVESWKYWAKKSGYWYPTGSVTPKRGDILVFEWDSDPQLDHIGITRGYTPGSSVIQTSEGNRGNKTGNFRRSISSVPGLIRIA